jgi:proteasome lid subunit RPN8/RPN11
LRFPRPLLEEIVEHAREDMPNECCGIVAASDGSAVQVFRARNVHESPVRFEIDGREVMKIQDEIDRQGWNLASLYHSHTRSPAYPSQTDVNFAELWPGLVWLIVSLEDPDNPSVRAYEIASGKVAELELEIDG